MMKIHYLKLPRILLAGFIVAGCQTLPVVPHAITCEVNAELLASKCATPRPITNDTTYATLIDSMQADRKALQECAVTVETLRDTLKRCAQAANEYNKKIDGVNKMK